ncbi:immunoglobulin super DCC subclass member [Perkinsus chesapeaki]|uniref:Immunoglobulin super DCC subclass member n=1 Tax=Perkinsus chesapeaki TaxID=330153 RepID=A0A7J6LNQ6_PERCH|nr:immunoglobulin super DCC subclass member [Perkinsus chesapeaki]
MICIPIAAGVIFGGALISISVPLAWYFGRNTVNVGELEPPEIIEGYTNLQVVVNPTTTALKYNPKAYIIETQAATTLNDGKDLGSNEEWTAALEVPYNIEKASTGNITGLVFREGLLVRYKIVMKDGRISNPSPTALATTKSPDVPSPPSQWGFRTSEDSVSFAISPPTDDKGATLFTVGGLPAAQCFQFRIAAENYIGRSDFSRPHFVCTDRPIPFEPPPVAPGESLTTGSPDMEPTPAPSAPGQVSSFALKESSSTSVTLSWAAPSDNGAMILNYVIITPEGDAAYTVPGDDTSYTVDELHPGSTYTFFIFASNSMGNGPESHGLVVETEYCEAGAPSPLQYERFSDGVALGFLPAADRGCTLPVTGFRAIDDSGTALCETSDPWCDITGLRANTSYKVRFQAKNSAGWSNTSTQPFRLTTRPSGKCTTRDQMRWWTSSSVPAYDRSKFFDATMGCFRNYMLKSRIAGCVLKHTKTAGNTPFNLPPITEECSECFGELGTCARKNCKWACMSDPSSEGCLECVEENCKSSGAVCMGL